MDNLILVKPSEKYIVNYYSNYDEEGRLDATKSGQVEFLTTMRYI